MIQRKLGALSLAVLALCITHSDAASLRMRGVGGGGSPPVEPENRPVLNDVAVNFGNYTANGMGGVRLSSMDDFTSYGLPIYGLGLQSSSGTACTTWTVTRDSGTSGHFLMVSGQAEGVAARTPVPSSAGDSANMNGGPYVFNVNCTDGNGNASNTAKLTYNIIADAANVDEYTGNFPGVTSGYGSFASTSGYKLLVSTGFKKLSSVTWSITCPVECTMTWADKSRPGLFQSFSPHSGQDTKLRLKDMQFTGDASASVLYFNTSTLGTNTLAIENVKVQFKPQAVTNSPIACLNTRWNGAPGDSIVNFDCNWVGLGMRISAPNYTIKNTVVRNFSTNAMDVDNTENLTLQDVLFYNPQVSAGGYHADCLQVSNGASVKNWNFKRVSCLTAGGLGATQGPIFPGHNTTGKGWVDDGAGGSGIKITLAPPVADPNAFFTPSANGSQIYAPGCIEPSDNGRLANSNFYNTADVLNITPRLCGSSSNPIDIAVYSWENMKFEGMVHTGYSYWGHAAPMDHGIGWFKNFAYVGHVPSTLYTTLAQADITDTTMTVYGPTTSNTFYNAGITAGGTGTGYGFSFPGMTGGAISITARLSGSPYCNLPSDMICTYIISRNPGNQTNVTISAVPPVGVPPSVSSLVQIKQFYGNRPWLHTGSYTFKDGWSSTGMVWALDGGVYQAFPPVNTTIANVYGTGTAPGTTAFANGDPKANLEAVPQTSWDTMTPAEVLALHCHYMLPKIGGLLDNGDGTFASPFKLVSGAGQWWDGIPVPGCN